MDYNVIYRQIHSIYLEINLTQTPLLNNLYLNRGNGKLNKGQLECELSYLKHEYERKILLINQFLNFVNDETIDYRAKRVIDKKGKD
jgi:hypothetical protein